MRNKGEEQGGGVGYTTVCDVSSITGYYIHVLQWSCLRG